MLLSLLATGLLGAALATQAADLTSGVNTKGFDSSVRAQDDFFTYVNGAWLKSAEIPADKSRWGTFDELREDVAKNLRGIIEGLAADKSAKPGSEAQKVADLYASYMDMAKRNQLGAAPLKADLALIDKLSNKKQVPALIASLNRMRVNTPVGTFVTQDGKDATKYVVSVGQSGLGLPDREYYLSDTDAKFKSVREKYQAHIEKMLTAVGDKDPKASAAAVVALETELARNQWTRVQNRDPNKTYNKYELAKLAELAPGYDWKSQLKTAGYEGKIDSVIVAQPSYLTGLAKVVDATPVSAWKAYFKWHVVSRYAPFLSQSFIDDQFAFTGTVLRGVPANEEPWKHAVTLVDGSLGDAVGKLYVAKYFPPEYKARMEKLVANLIAAYDQSIGSQDWMGEDTKKEAKKKLHAMAVKIGYTSKWRDYSAIKIDKSDLVGNLKRIAAAEYKRNLDRLGKPVDRAEWRYGPQTVNASYNPRMNDITFPAGILQPPFFNAAADDAVNYGGIGAVIGHEIGHGFDDSGSQSDEVGNLRNWWTAEDREKFSAKTKALIAQYDAFFPVPGYHVNGALTLGENIGDNSGLGIAYKAYHMSLNGQEPPVIDGFTADQRLFLGWAQVWRGKSRPDATIVLLKTDPHSPAEARGNVTLRNQPGFYTAFGVKEGDKMYLPPDQRVTIW